MRIKPASRIGRILGLSALLLTQSCETFDFLTDTCDEEFINVSWPATITRGNFTTNVTLTGAVSPGNIDPSNFNLLKQVLATGGVEILTNVVWTVNAFNVNGGYIAFMHPAPLSTGQTEPVNLAWDGGGWGVVPSARVFAPTVAVRAENFNATTATGSITAVTGQPLRLRIDVTTQSASGETMRLQGEAQFEYRKVTSNCS